MSTTQNARAAGGEKKRRDPRQRTPDFIQFDVTEGPWTRFFHRFFVRRMVTQDNNRPYPWFIGGVHRLARTLDVAFPWELIALAGWPVCVLLGWAVYNLGSLGRLGGLLILFLGCYTGFFFSLLVFLDRRVDMLDKMRINMMRLQKVEKRNDRLLRRRMAAKNAPEIERRNAEALARGQQKAIDHAADRLEEPMATVPPPPATARFDLAELMQ